MSKICGLAGPSLKQGTLEADIKRMLISMKHEEWHKVEHLTERELALGHLSVGAVNLDPQPVSSFEKNGCIIFCGKIFNYDEEINILKQKGYYFSGKNDPEFVLNFYKEYGTAKLDKLNGIFAFCIWDKTRRRLILVNDRYGLRPLYYFYDEGKSVICFASELKAMLSLGFVKRRVDWDAWNVFLRLGFHVGEDTFFKDIKVLAPGSALIFESGKISIENYWNYNHIKIRENFNDKEDIDKAVCLFKQAMKRRVIPGKKIGVLLSGGLDSRGIVAELRHLNVDFETFTTRKWAAEDFDGILAREVSEILGIKNHFYDLSVNFPEKEEDRKNFLLDFESDEHAWLLPLLEEFPSDVKINYDGIGQDIICDDNTGLLTDANQGYFDLLTQGRIADFTKKWLAKKYKFPGIDFSHSRSLLYFSRAARKSFSEEAFLEKVKMEFLKFSGNENLYLYFVLSIDLRKSNGNYSIPMAVRKL